MMRASEIRKSKCVDTSLTHALRRGGSLAEVYPAEVGGKAEMYMLSRWNHCRNDLAEVSAEVGGSLYAKSLISLTAEVSLALQGVRRRAAPASLRFAALPGGRSVPISYFEIDDIDLGSLQRAQPTRPTSRATASNTSSAHASAGAP